MSSQWEPAEQVAKNAEGKFVALIGGQWTPVAQASKDASGKFMVFRGIEDLKQAGVTKSSPPKFTPSGELPQPTGAEMVAGHPATRFALGAASPMLGLMQLVDNAAGGNIMNEHLKQLEEMKQTGRQAQGSEGLDVTELAGAVLNPASRLMPAAGGTMPQQIRNMAVAGGATGASMPVVNGGENFWEDKGAQTGMGVALGAVTPPAAAVATKAAKVGYHGLIEPAFEAGQKAIKGRAYLEAAGNKANEIIDLLTKNKQIVPGSMPTAGEAAAPAGRAEFSALQQSAANVKPSEYLSRADQQNAARIESLQEFAGNPAKRAEAVAAREARTEPHYDAGTTASTWSKIPGDLLERPSMKAALARAERLAAERNETFGAMGRPGVLSSTVGADAQSLKLAFDDLIKLSPKSGMDTAELAALKATRGDYIKWMETEFPDLGTARKLYKMTSQPVNEMDVGEALVNKLTPALREDKALRAGPFAEAVRDSAGTIKKATGEPRFEKLEDVLTSRSLNKVHNVQEDVSRADRNLDMGRKGAAAGPDALRLATGNLDQQIGGKPPTMLNHTAMLVNAVIARLEGKVNKKLAGEMAMEMLNPPKAGESLAAAQARELRNKALAEALIKGQRSGIIGGSAALATQGD